MLVKESISFERGKDPKEILGIGGKKYQYENMKKGDVFRIIRNLSGVGKHKGEYIKITDVDYDPVDDNEVQIRYISYSKNKKIRNIYNPSWFFGLDFFKNTFEKVDDIGFEK
jgi:hypothetical protein